MNGSISLKHTLYPWLTTISGHRMQTTINMNYSFPRTCLVLCKTINISIWHKEWPICISESNTIFFLIFHCLGFCVIVLTAQLGLLKLVKTFYRFFHWALEIADPERKHQDHWDQPHSSDEDTNLFSSFTLVTRPKVSICLLLFLVAHSVESDSLRTHGM